MTKPNLLSRLSVRLTLAFLLAATLGVTLVAVLAYRSTASDFRNFLGHLENMPGMMGGMMGGPAAQASLEFLQNLGRTLWIAGILGVVLAIILGWLFTRQIVAPLRKVSEAARRVAAGDFTQKVDTRGTSELAELGGSFNVMAAALDRDRESRKNLVADIAHELRTPLSVLQGNVEAMQDGVLEASAENLSLLHQETLLLARLVEDLRTLSLAESGQLKFNSRATDLNELFSKVLEALRTRFESKNIRLELEAPDRLAPVRVDNLRTEQVIRNLLNNAFQYTLEGGKIVVRLTPDADGIEASIADSGPGIPPEHLPRVFDRFYRVDRSRARSTGGSGLGLAIVKQLVEAQGGSVWVTSRVGRGSTFFFYLPYS
ncbi:MAG: ATP-binding protein [Chloroflexota bacterium]